MYKVTSTEWTYTVIIGVQNAINLIVCKIISQLANNEHMIIYNTCGKIKQYFRGREQNTCHIV